MREGPSHLYFNDKGDKGRDHHPATLATEQERGLTFTIEGVREREREREKERETTTQPTYTDQSIRPDHTTGRPDQTRAGKAVRSEAKQSKENRSTAKQSKAKQIKAKPSEANQKRSLERRPADAALGRQVAHHVGAGNVVRPRGPAAHGSQAERVAQDRGPAAVQEARQRTTAGSHPLQRVGVDLPAAAL